MRRTGICLTVFPDRLGPLTKAYRDQNLKPGVNFARHFRNTWIRIPLKSRRALLKYWRISPGRLQIQLSDFRLEKGMGASCMDGGFTLRFRPHYDLLAENMVASTIAHELAHAYWHSTDAADPLETEEENEAATNRIAEDWGFPQQ